MFALELTALAPHRFAATRRPDLSKLPEEALQYTLHLIIRTRV